MKYLLAFLFSLSLRSADVSLVWDPADSASGYSVTQTFSGVETQHQTTDTAIEIAGLKPGLNSFAVVAFNEFGTGEPSETISTNIPASILPPSSIQFGSALVSSSTLWSLTLKWSHQGTNAAGFKVTASRPDGSVVQTVIAKTKSAQLSKLPIGSTNIISIRAFDAAGNESEPSGPVSAIVTKSASQSGELRFETSVVIP